MNIQSLFKSAFHSLLIGLCYCTSAFAADAAELLNIKLSAIHTLQADFVQTVIDGQGRQLSQSEGHLSLERPGKFRWEVKHPDKQLIIAADKTIKVYDPSLQQMIVRPMPEQDANLPALLLSRADIPPERHFAISPEKNNPDKFNLIPRKKDALFIAFQIEFRGNELYRLTFTDHLNQTTVVVFKNEKRNQPLATAAFRFVPPKGTDIIYDKTS